MDIQNLKQKGRIVLPSLFTIGNVAFGFFAILSAIDTEYSRAGWFIILAMIMDAFDGRVARMVKGESKFGVEMDSLADFLSFGLAPAYVMYLFLLKDFGFWGYPVAFIFALCGSLRLAYFNVLSQEGKASKKYFSGLPIPMAAGILASFVISYSLLESNEVSRSFKLLQALMPMIYNLIPFIMLALGVLMVSRIPFPAFKQANFLRPKSIKTLLLLVVLVFLVIRYPQDALFLLFVVYAISGVLVYLWKGFRGMGKPKPDESAAQ